MPQFNRAKSLPQTPTTPTIVITEHLAGFELNHEEKKLGESTKMMLKMTKSPSFSAIETTKSQDSFDSMTYQNLPNTDNSDVEDCSLWQKKSVTLPPPLRQMRIFVKNSKLKKEPFSEGECSKIFVNR